MTLDEQAEGQTERAQPMASPSEWLFGEQFLRAVVLWSIVVAVLGGVIGWLLSAELAFAIGLWLGAALDIATFRYLALHGMTRLQAEGSQGLPSAVLLIRVALKGVLLIVAAVFATTPAFWGVFAGVLIVEFMIVVVGIVRSMTDVYRSKPGKGVQQ